MLEHVFVAVAIGTLVLALAVAAWVTLKAVTIKQVTAVKAELDYFASRFNPGDLVFGPNRFEMGWARAHQQTAVHHYERGCKLLLEPGTFWKTKCNVWHANWAFHWARHHLEEASGHSGMPLMEHSAECRSSFRQCQCFESQKIETSQSESAVAA